VHHFPSQFKSSPQASSSALDLGFIQTGMQRIITVEESKTETKVVDIMQFDRHFLMPVVPPKDMESRGWISPSAALQYSAWAART
jgi:hypothetical protein